MCRIERLACFTPAPRRFGEYRTRGAEARSCGPVFVRLFRTANDARRWSRKGHGANFWHARIIHPPEIGRKLQVGGLIRASTIPIVIHPLRDDHHRLFVTRRTEITALLSNLCIENRRQVLHPHQELLRITECNTVDCSNFRRNVDAADYQCVAAERQHGRKCR